MCKVRRRQCIAVYPSASGKKMLLWWRTCSTSKQARMYEYRLISRAGYRLQLFYWILCGQSEILIRRNFTVTQLASHLAMIVLAQGHIRQIYEQCIQDVHVVKQLKASIHVYYYKTACIVESFMENRNLNHSKSPTQRSKRLQLKKKKTYIFMHQTSHACAKMQN